MMLFRLLPSPQGGQLNLPQARFAAFLVARPVYGIGRMGRSAILWFCMASTGCTTIPENLWELNKTISHRFSYVSDQDKWCVSNYVEQGVTGDDHFTGDCEEYAFAIKHHLDHMGIPSSVWHVVSKENGIAHAVTCTASGWCLDYNTMPRAKEKTPYYFGEEIPVEPAGVENTGADAP